MGRGRTEDAAGEGVELQIHYKRWEEQVHPLLPSLEDGRRETPVHSICTKRRQENTELDECFDQDQPLQGWPPVRQGWQPLLS